MHTFVQVMSMSGGTVDGVAFLPLDFSQRPSEHQHVDVILHKLSEDIMFRWVEDWRGCSYTAPDDRSSFRTS